MKKPFRREFPSTVAGLQAYNKAKSNWNKKQRESKREATKGKPNRRDFPSTVEGLRAYNKAKSNWNKTKNKNLKDLRIHNKLSNQVGNNVPNSKQTSASIRGEQKKNDKSTEVKKDNSSKTSNSSKNGNGSSSNKPQYQQVTQKQLDKKIAEKKKVKPSDKLKVNYRRTKGEGIEGKSKGYRGDTRITKGLKKSGFTETRLAKLREKNAAFQKAKKGGKEAMKAYRKKYPKRG